MWEGVVGIGEPVIGEIHLSLKQDRKVCGFESLLPCQFFRYYDGEVIFQVL